MVFVIIMKECGGIVHLDVGRYICTEKKILEGHKLLGVKLLDISNFLFLLFKIRMDSPYKHEIREDISQW